MHTIKNPMNILVVEDEPKIARALKEGLERNGYKITSSSNGEEAFFLLNTQSFDLLILDILLPGRNGIEILKVVRQQNKRLPVLILTAKDSIEDKVEGLESGADDYLVKPFAFPELLARVKSLLRRSLMNTETVLQLEDLHIDFLQRRVKRGNTLIELTKREYEILEYLVRHYGQIVSREMLAQDVWKEASRATPLDNVMDVHFNRLRKKVDVPFTKKILHTIRGVGFKLDAHKDVT